MASDCLALDATDVANLLKVSKRHVANLNASGRLPKPIKLGRAVRWLRPELTEWLAAGAPRRDQWEAIKGARRVRGGGV